MNKDTKILIEKIEERLNSIEKIAIDQDILIKQLYEELYKKKLEKDECKKNVARYLAQKEAEVETTSEGKSTLPVLYKKWAKRLRV